jgi:hypothetical protein
MHKGLLQALFCGAGLLTSIDEDHLHTSRTTNPHVLETLGFVGKLEMIKSFIGVRLDQGTDYSPQERWLPQA